jgi:ADP-ribosylglycohydrolase
MAGLIDRALGALWGCAVGDALGMPTQTLTRAEISRQYGRIAGFVAPFPDHPVSHGLTAGQVTDDTEQTLLLGQLWVAGGGRLDPLAWAGALTGWEQGVRARGLRDLLGPSTKRALDALLAGVPADQTGRSGTTNGAAMRIAPVGIAVPAGDPVRLVRAVAQASAVTHATGEAIAAACAVAAVISAGVGGASLDAALPAALSAVRAGEALGAQGGAADMAGRIARAIDIAGEGEAALAARVGTSVASHQSVPCAFGVLRIAGGDPWAAGLIAANIGDDTDTIGAIACAMAGACAGVGAFPADRLEQVARANGFDPLPLATALLALRDRPGQVAA